MGETRLGCHCGRARLGAMSRPSEPSQDKKINPGDGREDMKKRKNDASQRNGAPSRLIDARIKEWATGAVRRSPGSAL